MFTTGLKRRSLLRQHHAHPNHGQQDDVLGAMGGCPPLSAICVNVLHRKGRPFGFSMQVRTGILLQPWCCDVEHVRVHLPPPMGFPWPCTSTSAQGRGFRDRYKSVLQPPNCAPGDEFTGTLWDVVYRGNLTANFQRIIRPNAMVRAVLCCHAAGVTHHSSTTHVSDVLPTAPHTDAGKS